MKIKSIKFSGDKQYLHFDDKTIICTPEDYDFEVGMNLDLKFDGVTFDRNNEIITIFTLSNNEVNFNLYINDGTRYGDDANLLSTFVKIKELPKISPIHFLVKELEEDEGYKIGWIANVAMSFVDNFDKNKSLHENANIEADKVVNSTFL